MSNACNKDKNSSGDNHRQVPEATGVVGDGTLMTGEQSVATSETRVADLGTLQHFQTALMNLVSEANKLGLTLPIGLGIFSPYDLITSMHGDYPPGRLRLEVHIATPEAETKPSMEETP